ncbi:hypothetical protein CLCAR_1348 [Clostridium carboxidivorans P7]|nr:hypothetical protein CLCAR_1348 [Clostridium carboxidivorans P7]
MFFNLVKLINKLKMTTSLKNVDEYDIMCMQIYNNGSLDGIM